MATTKQLRALADYLKTSSDQTVAAAINGRDYAVLADWLNAAGTLAAWMPAASRQDLFESMNISTYDTVASGKKDSWKMMLDFAPIDFTSQKMRKAIVDIFVTADANAALSALTFTATRAEEILGGDSATTGTVTALKLKFVGAITADEIKTVV